MSSSNQAQRKTKYGSLSLDDAMEKLRETYETIRLRGGIKKCEEGRLREALRLVKPSSVLSTSIPSGSNATAVRHGSYQQVLKRVEKTSGLVMVALCAVGLGKSAISSMKDANKLRLSEHIKLETDTLTSATLQALVHEYLKEVSPEVHPPPIQPQVANKLPSLNYRSVETIHKESASEDLMPILPETQVANPEIEFAFSHAPIELLPSLCELILKGIESSQLYTEERLRHEPRSACITVFIRPRQMDGSIIITTGSRSCHAIRNALSLNKLDLALTSPPLR